MTEKLLADKTTGKNIIWAAEDYPNFKPQDEITIDAVNLIKPRYEKVREEQKRRTKSRAEIFTPAHICKLQNDLIDEKYFGAGEKTWQEYILQRRLEITCGEAPYLVSRYDAVTGAPIAIENRIGLLDRKFRLVSENAKTQADWENWAVKAVQNIYGYEFQGDNLFLARRNIFLSFAEYFQQKFDKDPARKLLEDVAEIICWNLWQMDGLNYKTVAYSLQNKGKKQDTDTNLFARLSPESFLPENQKIYCVVKDWQSGEISQFRNLLGVLK